jgi:hypothetical protein
MFHPLTLTPLQYCASIPAELVCWRGRLFGPFVKLARMSGGHVRRLAILGALTFIVCAAAPDAAAACVATGFSGMTAALVNPSGTVSGPVDASGCDMGVYYDTGGGKLDNAQVFGAKRYGVFVNGDNANLSVDILDSHIYQIGDQPFTGNQDGVAIYYRAYLSTGTATGRVAGNTIELYQKGGIVANGPGTDVQVQDNEVLGQGPVAYIAQNGIQIGYGANASVMKNHVTGHSYTGTSTVSGGIIVVGGPGYGACPDGNACAYTVGTRIMQNTVEGNDIGIFLTNINAAGGPAPSATNVKAVNNTVSSPALTNNYGGLGYQAGVSDVGNNDKIINNSVSGAGYDAAANPSAYTVEIDADTSFTNRPKVHANE